MKPSILVTRAIFPDVIERLAQYFDVDDNQEDLVLDSAALRDRLAGKAGVLANAADRIDGELVGACRSCVPYATWRSATTTSICLR
jgi:lactate dehydrogenase-like 2-hydroxyacid dehydrogenase